MLRAWRSVLAAAAILGLLAAVVGIHQRRDDHSDAPLADPHSSQPAAAGAPVTVTLPPSRPGAAPAAGTGDEVDDACVRLIDEAAAFAAREKDAAHPVRNPDPDHERLYAELASFQRSLAGSGNPEHLVVALVLELGESTASQDRSVHTTLQDLGDRAALSGSPLLSWHALRICVMAGERCPFAHLEQRLLEPLRRNAEAWALVAMLRHRRGDVAGALAAVQGAARAPESTWYWTETIALIERVLAAGTAIPYPERLQTTFGMSTSALPAYPVRMCDAESASSREWAQACLAFGTLRAARNETMLARGQGLLMRERAFTALGEAEAAARVSAERQLLDAQRRGEGLQMSISTANLQETLLATDPARLADYLDAIRQHREWAGMRVFLGKELPPLMERAGLLERDGASECIARLAAPVGQPRPAAESPSRTGAR